MVYVRVYFNGVLVDQVELQKEQTTIGRAQDNDIQIENAGVSAHHARIVREGENYYIEDTNSTNGTSVNGERVTRIKLQYGDTINVFKHTLQISPLALETGNDKAANDARHSAESAGTVDIDVSQLEKLLEQQKPVKGAYLLINGKQGQQRRRPLTRKTFTIGKDPLNDLVVHGWFLPQSIATLDHRVDGFYLVPSRRGRIFINGNRVRKDAKLQNGDNISARGLSAQFLAHTADNS